MKQYLDLCNRVIDKGVWVENKRTGKKTLTIINANMEYDCRKHKLPILTTKKTFYKAAIAEMIGYLRGYSSASDFRDLGTKTWDANANENEAWLKNPRRKGKDDMGRAYRFRKSAYYVGDNDKPAKTLDDLEYVEVDQYKEIIELLKQDIDNRILLMSAYQPHSKSRACLNPCMHTHQFSILDGTLYLNSVQRSADAPLGVPFNMVQCAFLLMITAQITGLKPGIAYHSLVNFHLYEDQVEIYKKEQRGRVPYSSPTLKINPNIKTLEDLETWVTTDDFELIGYEHHPVIKYPFSV